MKPENDYSRNSCLPNLTFARFLDPAFLFLGTLAFSCLFLANPAWPQSLDVASGMLPEITLRGQGWEQMQNIPEMLEFVLALVEATVLTALISYHPVSLAARRSQTDYEIPKTLFIYSLIGMVVGFLVMHHGYLIGFVVFGIGGLLRFKSEFESEGHTMRLILATLIGLCVGLDLPVMALILAGSAWAILFFFGARLYYTLELRFDSKKSSKLNVDALSEFFRLHGFTPVSVTKKKYKQTAEFVLSASRGTDRDKLSREMAVLQSSKQHGIDDWHLE